MNKTLVRDVIALTSNGWRPYPDKPDNAVYTRIGCPHWQKANGPFWFVRDRMYLCVGCASRCLLENPAGFMPMLPMRYAKEPPRLYNITPKEMLERHNLLTVRQAAYCLNVAERTIYDYIAEGKLVRLREKPTRVRASDVKAMCEDFDE
ncbi:MAG: helix-turn-helix domain-containing protein [Desulfovibrionaceae bacterium]|nr:helix-turn-helix domain-containing protein [Desulfovibrionaceae bacterium]